jgi:Leucine-rich repeat (LRR) protein
MVLMQVLQLSGNNITATVPLEWKSLVALKDVLLANNSLSGSIPDGLLQSWTVLQSFNVKGNNLTGPLPGLPNAIQVLNLADNMLEGTIPSKYGEAQNLTALYLGRNQLTGPLPPELGQLGVLKELDLSLNRLKGSIPMEWANMASLEVLTLSKRAEPKEGNVVHGTLPFKTCGLTKLNV